MRLIPAAIVLSIMVLSLSPAAAQQAGEAEVEQLRRDNERLREENARLRAELTQLRGALGAPDPGVDAATPAGGESDRPRIIVVQQRPDASGELTPRITVTRPVPLQRQQDEQGRHILHTRFVAFNAPGALDKRLWMRLQRVEGGASEERPVEVVIETRGTRSVLRGLETVTLDIDGRRIECPVESYSAQRETIRRARTNIRLDDERLVARVDPALLREVAQSQSTKLTLGTTTMELTMDQVMLFAALGE